MSLIDMAYKYFCHFTAKKHNISKHEAIIITFEYIKK